MLNRPSQRLDSLRSKQVATTMLATEELALKGNLSCLKGMKRHRRVAATLMACFVLVVISGCNHSTSTGLYVNHENPNEVDMLRLVESPPGHLSGSLVISALNANGSRKKDAVYDVSGTITGPNVSLQVEGGLVGLAEFFGASTNLVGSLRGRTLTLSAGNQTEILHKTSEKQYGAVLASLDEAGHHVSMAVQAVSAVQKVGANDRKLNSDLKQYIAWSQQRINHVSAVRQWYADRARGYSNCLQRIRPLAAQGVPSWRWQGCVLDVENDEYSRNQEAQLIQGVQGKNAATVAGLDARINAAKLQFPKVLNEVKSACPYSKNVEGCEKVLRKLSSLSPDGLLSNNLIAEYRSIVPRVSAALRTDLQISVSGQGRLESIAEEVKEVYQSAR